MRAGIRRRIDRLAFAAICLRARLGGIGTVTRYLRNPRPGISVRLLRACGARVGDRTRIKGGLLLDNASGDATATGDFRHLQLGDNCFVGEDVYLDLAAPIVIADDTMLSARVALLTHADAGRSPAVAQWYPRVTAGIRIERGCWIGFGAVLLPGVTLGAECVVAAGAVVAKSVPARTLVAGVPARPVKSLPPAPDGSRPV